MNEMRNACVGEKRNMSALEKKVDALVQFCMADSEESRNRYYISLQRLMLSERQVQSEFCLEVVDQMLADLGIPNHLLGYNYLQTAISLAVCNPTMRYNMNGDLYPAVALRYGVRLQSVERNIRHAIECGWDRCDEETRVRYFGGTVHPERSKPTNSEFIARVSRLIRRQYS